jgi:hypothetical protein
MDAVAKCRLQAFWDDAKASSVQLLEANESAMPQQHASFAACATVLKRGRLRDRDVPLMRCGKYPRGSFRDHMPNHDV